MEETSLFAYAIENMSSCLVASLYITASVALTLVNKIVLTTFKFDFPAFVMFLRTLCTVTGLGIANEFGYFSIPTYSVNRGKLFALPSLFYSINAVLALSALGRMNIAFYAVLKRCTPLITMILSVCILKTDFPPKLMIASLIILAAGCIIAGIGDMTFSLVAYALCAISNVAQSLHLLFLQRVSKNGLSPIECLHLNSINSLPFFAINVVLFGELGPILNFPYYTDPTFILIFVMQICLGCLLTYLLILCTSMTSAVTTTVIGGLKALFQIAVGIITLGGLSNNLMTYVGLSMSITGVVTYLISKIREKMTVKSVDLKLVTISTGNGNEMKDENVNTECDSQKEKAELKTVKLDNV